MKVCCKLFFVVLFFCLALHLPHLAHAKRRPVSRIEVAPPTDRLILEYPGRKGAAQYEKWGEFKNVGTGKYRYVIHKKRDLADDVGEGIFPNRDVYRNPAFRKLKKNNELDGNHWNYVETRETAKNFFKWATTNEKPGIKAFYVAMMLERSGLIEEAIKGFYAVVVHFPKTMSYTYYNTPWYPGVTALDRVEQLLRRHPKIKMKLEGAGYDLNGIFDTDTRNDKLVVNPGRLLDGKNKVKKTKIKKMKVEKVIGGPRVQLKKFTNGHWSLFVNGKPFVVRAITYSVTPVGLSPDDGSWNPSKDWQLLDTNKNRIHDSLFESFVDVNGNNKQDSNEPTVGDAKLLQDMGINAIRAYHHLYNKEIFQKLYKEYGISVIVGDLIGVYAVGSGATWDEGTDYTDPGHRKKMLASVQKMVEEYKGEDFVLMWALGNENAYGVANNAGKNPDAYYKFVNEVAKLIHELDPSRPVVHVNGDVIHLDKFAAYTNEVDIFGANAYRGEQGFGRHLFKVVSQQTGKPVLITEYGCSAKADPMYTQEEVEAFQAMYVANNWEDLEAHMAGQGVGNVLGGVIFEWVDEWWKLNADLPDHVKLQRADWYASRKEQYINRSPSKHDEVPAFGLPFLDGWSYEEWFGMAGLGNGTNSVFVRQLRPAYYTMQKMWDKYQD